MQAPPRPGTSAVPLHQPDPVYPSYAQRNGLEGFVDLVMRVDEEGRVTDVEVLASEPGSVFVRAARSGVKRWRFRPATRDGRPVPSKVRQRITFRMD